jgi:hypothetical protein
MGQSVGALKDRPVSELQEAFHKWIQLPDCSEKHGRERLFTTARTFWLFLSQILSEKSSCREAVRRFLAWLALEAERGASPNTAAYCKARARLEQKYLKEINGQIVTTALAAETEKNLWHGHRVKVIDGSGISMPDTPENQKVWPQPKGAKPGCSYPVIRMVAVFSLATGALIAMAKGRLKVSERNLFRRLWDRFEPNDVALADRGFCGYADFYFLVRRGVACVMRNNQRRMVGISLVKRINKNDRLVEWHKMRPCPKWLDKKAWDAVPERMTVREVTFSVDIPGFRTERIIIVTTLLDLKKYTASDFTDLYLRRWRAELYLRDIKTTMGMDILTCKTPKMINKELQMYLIAYNLIRLLMQEASCTYGTPPDRISFMGVIATVRTWAIALVCRGLSRAKRALLYELMLLYIIKDQLPIRQCRSEPRAKKRRPKSYQLLTKPRHLFKEVPHKSKYSKLLS